MFRMFQKKSLSIEHFAKLILLNKKIEDLKTKIQDQDLQRRLLALELSFLKSLESAQNESALNFNIPVSLDALNKVVAKYEIDFSSFSSGTVTNEEEKITYESHQFTPSVDNREQQPETPEKARAQLLGALCKKVINNMNYWEEAPMDLRMNHRMVLSISLNPQLYDTVPKGIMAMRGIIAQYTSDDQNWTENHEQCKEFLKAIKKIAINRLNDKITFFCLFSFDNPFRNGATTTFYEFLKNLDVDKLTNDDYVTALKTPAIAKGQPQRSTPAMRR